MQVLLGRVTQFLFAALFWVSTLEQRTKTTSLVAGHNVCCRLFQILIILVTLLQTQVGRIDVAFLSPNVVLCGYAFDYVPINFVKDLLVHEAHRHPYLERLSQMYLMKLRYKDFLSSNAAAAWRQLVIVAFFPWLAKYRVFDEERREEARAALAERRREEQLEAQGRGLAAFDAAIANAGPITRGIGTTITGVTEAVGRNVADPDRGAHAAS